MMLEIDGHTTHLAYDGLEAIEVAGAVRPEIVLIDIGMPRLNGYDACRRIRVRAVGARDRASSRSPAGARPTTACAPRTPASTTTS